MIPELAVLAAVLAAATGYGLARRRTGGRLDTLDRLDRSDRSDDRAAVRLGPDDLGGPLGAAGTIVQFSTGTCAACPPTRRLLTEVAAQRAGVRFVEIEAERAPALTRRLGVLRTPTVLVLDRDGVLVSRGSGTPDRAAVLAALAAAT